MAGLLQLEEGWLVLITNAKKKEKNGGKKRPYVCVDEIEEHLLERFVLVEIGKVQLKPVAQGTQNSGRENSE